MSNPNIYDELDSVRDRLETEYNRPVSEEEIIQFLEEENWELN